MLEMTSSPRTARRLVLLSVVFFLTALILTGFNAYTTLAAPRQSPHVPSVVGFEGQLANAAGQPVADGNYTITFSLYSQAEAGTALWNETQNVAVADGLYSVQLGSETPLNPTHFEGNRWLGVQVSGDSEMSPRIPISAVPFALNARQAMGLQGFDVSTTSPTDGHVLTWNNTTSQWEPNVPGARTLPELNSVGSNESPQNFLANYRQGAALSYVDMNTVRVAPGEIMINGLMRRNLSAVDVQFAGTAGGPNRGLDTGAAQANTTYYVYAVGDDAETTFDLIISANSTTPTGPTNYRRLGRFATDGATKIGLVADDLYPTQPHIVATAGSGSGTCTVNYWVTVNTVTIPGGVLGLGNMLEIRVPVTYNWGGEPPGFNIVVAYGGGTIFSGGFNPGGIGGSGSAAVDIQIWGNGSVTGQLSSGTLVTSRGVQTGYFGSTAIDSSVDKTLTVTLKVGDYPGCMYSGGVIINGPFTR